tara:strand:+ start:37 stop:705 length:669 start_codon:yes stop_codon:yes gene_type:complete
VIPLYNESENIKPLLREIFTNLLSHENFEIVLVNDASTDNTSNVVKNLINNKVRILHNKTNRGQSFSIHKGIQNSSFDTIVTLDGDGQNDPADIPKLINKYFESNKLKLLGGIRSKRKDSLIKVLSSKIANKIRSKILNDGCQDTGCSLKVFDKKIFLTFPYFDGMHRFIPALYKGYGFETNFIDVNHRKRKYGTSKYGTMNRLFKGIRDLIKVRNILKNKV